MEKERWEKLDICKRSDELALKVFQLTKSFPKEEIYDITSQVRRSVIEVIPEKVIRGFQIYK